MTIRRVAFAALLAIPLALTACGNADEAPDSATITAISTTSSTTSATTSTTTSSATPEPLEPELSVEEPAAAAPVPAQRGIWAPPGQGTRCPGTDAYVWDYADCNPSNGVIDPEEFYRLIEPTPTYDEPYRSDGCIGPAAVCGYYDENGEPIWWDQENQVSSPRYYDENGDPTMEAP